MFLIFNEFLLSYMNYHRFSQRSLFHKHLYLRSARARWFKNRLKAERAWFLDRRSRRAKPETEQALPQRLLGGGTASLSPFRRSPRFHRGSLPPLLGLAPCDRGDTPPRLPQPICGKPQTSKACSVSGFALLSLRSRNHARSTFKRFSQHPA